MPRGRPVDETKRAQVLALHAKGLGRNAIARETGVGAASVTAIVQAADGDFDRTATAVAVQARRVDLADLRSRINERLLTRAYEFLDQMDKPFVVYNFGGKDNTFERETLERPPSGAIKDLMTSVGIAVQRSNELTKVDADPAEGLPAVDAWLRDMTE